ncbi:MAG TPA: cell division protein FtsL [Firmicutes bacterium]|nr:cell division protein FtsL [Bacillota bacterium]
MFCQKKYRRRRKSARGPLVGLTFLVIMVTGLALGVGVQYTALARAEISLDSARSRLQELKRQADWLETQLASLTSPARIEQVATTKLGMVRPTEVREIEKPVPPVVAASLVPPAEDRNTEGGVLQKLVDRLSQGIQRAQAKPRK